MPEATIGTALTEAGRGEPVRRIRGRKAWRGLADRMRIVPSTVALVSLAAVAAHAATSGRP